MHKNSSTITVQILSQSLRPQINISFLNEWMKVRNEPWSQHHTLETDIWQSRGTLNSTGKKKPTRFTRGTIILEILERFDSLSRRTIVISGLKTSAPNTPNLGYVTERMNEPRPFWCRDFSRVPLRRERVCYQCPGFRKKARE